jgi:type I restriction enzyme, S subunit
MCGGASEHQGAARVKATWHERALGDIADVSAGNPAPQDPALFKNGKYPFFRTADIGRIRFGEISVSTDRLNDAGIKKLRRYPKQTILFPKSGASTFLNHRVMLATEGYVSSHLATIIPHSSQVDAKFLLYFLSTVAAQDLVQDHAYPSLNLPLIAGIAVRAPGLAEQQRIVGVLDDVFAGLAAAQASAEQNFQNARALFESHIDAIFTRGGNEWVERKLGDVCDLFQGLCINAKTKHLLVEKSTLPLLRIKDLRSNSAEQYIADSGWPKSAFVSASDIIYTRTGNSLGLVFRGRVGILHNNSFKVKPRSSLNGGYLYWWLQSPQFRAKVTKLASKAAQPDITHVLFKAQKIAVPPPAYQERAAQAIENIREQTQQLEGIYEQKLERLAALKTSLLHHAFTGQL